MAETEREQNTNGTRPAGQRGKVRETSGKPGGILAGETRSRRGRKAEFSGQDRAFRGMVGAMTQADSRPPKPSAGADGFDLDIDGAPVRVTLIRRASARRYVLRVRAGDVRLTLPARGTQREARAFAERQRDWIRTRLKRLPEPVRLADGSVIPLYGQPHTIEHREAARGVVWVEPGDCDPLLPEDARPRLCVSGRHSHLRRRLRDWLEAEAHRMLSRHVRVYARRLGVAVKRVSVRDQKSRWGACSASGTLTFSWRLILAPDFVVAYLAAHEVVHLKEMNHSPRYWRILKDLCADTERAEAWLRAHGSALHRYDAS
jgi:hypothetical protein